MLAGPSRILCINLSMTVRLCKFHSDLHISVIGCPHSSFSDLRHANILINADFVTA